jgi:V8-like Glu-specific endopeptidase
MRKMLPSPAHSQKEAKMLEDEQPSLWLDRAADDADYAVIGPTDGRTRVLNTRRAPYSAVCHVERDFGDNRWSGCSGFAIAPNVIITAGHCVYSAARARLGLRATPAQFRVSPGRNGAREPFGKFGALRWFAHRSFVRSMNREADYGVVVLDRLLPAAVRPLRLLAPNDAQLAQIRSHRLLHIAGYPGDKPPGSMWEHAERLDRHTATSLFYSVDTCPGHSGSGIWCQIARDGPVALIGIHVAGPTPHARGVWGCRPGVPMAPAGMFNRGIRLTGQILRQFDAVARGGVHPELLRFNP